MAFIYTDSDRIAELHDLAARPREAVSDARSWLQDCFADEDGDIAAANTARIVQGVEYHYEGGWQQFLTDSLNLKGASA